MPFIFTPFPAAVNNPIMCRKNVCFFFFFILGLATAAQNACPPFWTDIQKFKQKDSAQQPQKNAILFVGSSSFTNWKNVQDYFRGYTIINRGFGGSSLTDVIRYAYDIILPYRPKQVVIYCGENDFSSDSTLQAGELVLRFKTLFGIIRQNLPQATIHFISLKPSPARAALLSKFTAANAQIRAFLKTQQRAGYIDVYPAMLTSRGVPRPDIFLEDNLHMNEKGYQIWQRIIQPYLLKK
jgi:lysophospholipase L1-like esterase